MIYFVGFVVLILATARLTRLIYFDDLTRPLRLWIDQRFGTDSFVSRLVWCPWCASIWVSVAVTTLAMGAMAIWGQWPPGGAIVAGMVLVPALAYPAGWLVDFETTRTSRGE